MLLTRGYLHDVLSTIYVGKSFLAHRPVDVLHKGINIRRPFNAIVYYVCMLIDIHYQHWYYARGYIEVVRIKAIIMQFSVIEAVAEDYPSTGSYAACLKILLPCFK